MSKLISYTGKLRDLGMTDPKRIEQLSKRFKVFLETLPSGFTVNPLEHAQHDFDNIQNPIKYK